MREDTSSWIQNFILLWIVEHGGEWPDWGDPYSRELATLAAISALASRLENDSLRETIQGAVKQGLRQG